MTTMQNENTVLYVWGSNCMGQIGLEDVNQQYTTSPTQLMLGLKIVSVACGGEHTMILTSIFIIMVPKQYTPWALMLMVS